MGIRNRTLTSIERSSVLRLVGAAVFLILVVRGGVELSTELVAASPPSFCDTDNDGLSDDFEMYLSIASTDPALESNPFNQDTDGDGQPDGFEYALSSRTAVVTPAQQFLVEPRVVLGSHQVANNLLLTLYVIPYPAKIDDFRFLISIPNPAGAPYVFDLTELLALNIKSVGTASYGPYKMGVFRTSIPVGVLQQFDSVAIAALGDVAGVRTGDSGTFTVYNGSAFRWVYKKMPAQPPGSGQGYWEGEAQPQQSSSGGGTYQAAKVCSTTDVLDPTEVKGVLESIALAINCNGGTWVCDASICTAGGPASKPKVVLDHFQLLQ